MRSVGVVELLVGMVASGKTRYAKKRAGEGAVVVSREALHAMLSCDGPGPDDRRFPALLDRVENVLAAVAVVDGRDVVVDGEHLTRAERARWVKFGREMGCAVVAVRFPCGDPSRHAQRRYFEYRAGDQGVSLRHWLNVATRQARLAESEPLDVVAEGLGAMVLAP